MVLRELTLIPYFLRRLKQGMRRLPYFFGVYLGLPWCYLGLPWCLPWCYLGATLVYLVFYIAYLVFTLFFWGLPYPLPYFFRGLPCFGVSRSLYSLLSVVLAIASRRLSQLAVSSSLYLSCISVAFSRIRLRLARSVVACACSSKVARYLVSQLAP